MGQSKGKQPGTKLTAGSDGTETPLAADPCDFKGAEHPLFTPAIKFHFH